MGSDICHFKGLDAQKPECYVKNSEKNLFWSKSLSKFTFLTFLYLVFVITTLFFIQNSCRFEHKCIYNMYRDSAENKFEKIKKIMRRRPIFQIAHFEILATFSAHTENVKAFIQSI